MADEMCHVLRLRSDTSLQGQLSLDVDLRLGKEALEARHTFGSLGRKALQSYRKFETVVARGTRWDVLGTYDSRQSWRKYQHLPEVEASLCRYIIHVSVELRGNLACGVELRCYHPEFSGQRGLRCRAGVLLPSFSIAISQWTVPMRRGRPLYLRLFWMMRMGTPLRPRLLVLPRLLLMWVPRVLVKEHTKNNKCLLWRHQKQKTKGKALVLGIRVLPHLLCLRLTLLEHQTI